MYIRRSIGGRNDPFPGAVMNGEIIDRVLIYDDWLKLYEVKVRLPNGAVEIRRVEDHGRAAAVLLYDPDRRMALLVQQPRAPLLDVGGDPVLEVVAGGQEGKSAEATAYEECLEEAGVAVKDLEHIGTVWSMPSVSTEYLELYLAQYCAADRIQAGGGAAHENECITVHEIPLKNLWKLMTSHRPQDGKTLMLVQGLRMRRPELFE